MRRTVKNIREKDNARQRLKTKRARERGEYIIKTIKLDKKNPVHMKIQEALESSEKNQSETTIKAWIEYFKI